MCHDTCLDGSFIPGNAVTKFDLLDSVAAAIEVVTESQTIAITVSNDQVIIFTFNRSDISRGYISKRHYVSIVSVVIIIDDILT